MEKSKLYIPHALVANTCRTSAETLPEKRSDKELEWRFVALQLPQCYVKTFFSIIVLLQGTRKL